MSEEMLLNLFSRLDKSGDGILSKEELKQGLRSSGVTENTVNVSFFNVNSFNYAIIIIFMVIIYVYEYLHQTFQMIPNRQ